ncbi:hypothetical protein ACWDR1_01845 [Streptosporangium sandarakinum]
MASRLNQRLRAAYCRARLRPGSATSDTANGGPVAGLDPHGAGWTLHRLRHSALPRLAAAGRTVPEPPATSRHQHLAGLGRYTLAGPWGIREEGRAPAV